MSEIRHIGIMWLCGIDPDTVKDTDLRTTHREDMSYREYKSFERGRFRDEKPFKYCKRCLAVIKAREKRFR